jgi:hypothetical protein
VPSLHSGDFQVLYLTFNSRSGIHILNFMDQYLVFSARIQFLPFFRISNFFGLSTTDETLVDEMRIWCIKIGIVLVLHLNPWVEACAGGL